MDLISLNRSRAVIKGKITSFTKFLDTNFQDQGLINDLVLNDLRLRLGHIETSFDSFNDIQSQIESLHQDPNFIDHDERESFEMKYYSICGRAQGYLKQRNIARSNNNSEVDEADSGNSRDQSHVSQRIVTRGSSIKLPRIDLPSFNGDYTKYREFHDVFRALVDDNDRTSDAEKLCYLKMCVKGEAANLLASFDTTDANYAVAFQLLNERYDNMRLTIYNHVKELLELEAVTRESHVSLRILIDQCERHIRALKNLQIPVEHWDAIVVPIITSKLDQNTVKAWETQVNCKDHKTIPKYPELIVFLNLRQRTLEAIAFKKPIETKDTKKRFAGHLAGQTETNKCCSICRAEHALYQCNAFLRLSVQERIKHVKQNKLCNNCLKPGHFANNCKSGNCRICNRKHNSLLHFLNEEIAKVPIEQKELSCFSPHSNNSGIVILSTALVNIIGKNDQIYTARALLDNGSTSCLMTEAFAEKIGLTGNLLKEPIFVCGIGNHETQIKKQIFAETISMYNDFKLKINYLVTKQITGSLPFKSFDIKQLDIPQNIRLADPTFNKSGNLDILIGASIFWNLLRKESFKLQNHNLVLTNTHLGWIIGGHLGIGENTKNKQVICVSLQRLHNELQRFWEIEDFGKREHYSAEEAYCETHFKGTHTRDEHGRYIVRLPLKAERQTLGDSREIAIKRFESLERKLQSNETLKTRYVEFLDEYIRLGHMKAVDSSDGQQRVYLPHHGVLKESSTTTKLRVVFDASCKTSSGISVNDIQCIGPQLQRDLFSILNNFRMYQYVVTGDIEKMYRMITVHPEDRSYQCILWRSDPSKFLETYELCTVTYGTACASYLATKCVWQLAEEQRALYPAEADIIQNCFYVDDLIFGANTVSLLKQQRETITKILQSGCFILRKWRSNIPEMNETNTQLVFDQVPSKILGILWEPNEDVLMYDLGEIVEPSKITKRTILATTAKLFDPFGLLAPIIIIPKLIIQKLWCKGVGWDEPVDSGMQNKWHQFTDDLKYLKYFKIPRFALCKGHTEVQLHGFSDASESAYGACVYLRTVTDDGHVSVNLLAAKSKVAPLKTLSLPRLELNAALILAQLVDKLRSNLNIQVKSEHLWCDSTIVIAWLRADPSKWVTYVANRTSEIRLVTDITSWNHVRSEENPADLISRGVLAGKLKDSRLWWCGPHWLAESKLPNHNLTNTDENIPELRNIVLIVNRTFSTEIFERYSNLDTLINVILYCLRFKTKQKGELTSKERRQTLHRIISVIQTKHFSKEISALRNEREIPRDSSLLSLNPFIDNDGLLRVRGRLSKANINFDAKHQIILPDHEYVTSLIASDIHIKSLHSGPQAMVCHMRQMYWPIKAKNLARFTFRKCVKCFRARPTITSPLMGDLPYQRINPSPPFSVCGLDYAGPIIIKESRLRKARQFKAYFAIFVCFATKATHLEVVTDLTTDSFLAALRRFVGRRGRPSQIYSDNATNFVGADRAFKELVCSRVISESLVREGIQWKFIPARSPHMGGLWESNVKVVKNHLKRVVGNTILTLEGMQTLLIQIESMLNSRPITEISNHPEDFNPLTPGHFLIGRPLNHLPSLNVSIHKTEFANVQKMFTDLWNRWKSEYLHQMQVRQKWNKKIKPPRQGQLVILIEENTPPLKWPLGRIVQLHPGTDGEIRVASVQTAGGITRRAVHKLCFLPEESNGGGMLD